MFKGWTPAWIRLSPNTIIVLCVGFLRLVALLLLLCNPSHSLTALMTYSITLEQLKKSVDWMRGNQ